MHSEEATLRRSQLPCVLPEQLIDRHSPPFIKSTAEPEYLIHHFFWPGTLDNPIWLRPFLFCLFVLVKQASRVGFQRLKKTTSPGTLRGTLSKLAWGPGPRSLYSSFRLENTGALASPTARARAPASPMPFCTRLSVRTGGPHPYPLRSGTPHCEHSPAVSLNFCPTIGCCQM